MKFVLQKYLDIISSWLEINQFYGMERAFFIGLGSNLGDRHAYLDRALDRLSLRWGTSPKLSSRYETPPWEMDSNSPEFINQVAQFDVDLEPEQAMLDLQCIEKELGRVRSSLEGYQSRTIDLDLLAIEGIQLSNAQLTVPHPQIANRRFVLEPFAELAPNFKIHLDGSTIADLLRNCPDTSTLNRLNLEH